MSRLVVFAAIGALAAGVAGGGWAYGDGPFAHRGQAVASTTAIPATTALVSRGTITQSEQDAGTIGYAGSFTVYTAVAGTVTWLPAGGTVIRPGHRLFSVDGQNTVLMGGQTPAWRAFAPGMTAGADVTELQRNMIALGYDPYRAITVDGSYDWATQVAVERWQAAEGWTQNAQIPVGQVAFQPGALRVASASTGTGAMIAPGAPVLSATSTTPVVTVSLPAQEQAAVAPGQRVTITLPDGTAAAGQVTGVSSQASSGSGGGPGSSGSNSSGSNSSSGSSSAGSSPASVSVTVSIADPVTGLDGAPVQVAIATQTQPDALIVPISALLARPGGGYQVTVVTGQTQRDVTVALGLFDDLAGDVAITGPGIVPGTRVVVASS
jgi:hypothetical protein